MQSDSELQKLYLFFNNKNIYLNFKLTFNYEMTATKRAKKCSQNSNFTKKFMILLKIGTNKNIVQQLKSPWQQDDIMTSSHPRHHAGSGFCCDVTERLSRKLMP